MVGTDWGRLEDELVLPEDALANAEGGEIVFPPKEDGEDELDVTSDWGKLIGLRFVEIKPPSGDPPKLDDVTTFEENEEPVFSPPTWANEDCETGSG